MKTANMEAPTTVSALRRTTDGSWDMRPIASLPSLTLLAAGFANARRATSRDVDDVAVSMGTQITVDVSLDFLDVANLDAAEDGVQRSPDAEHPARVPLQ